MLRFYKVPTLLIEFQPDKAFALQARTHPPLTLPVTGSGADTPIRARLSADCRRDLGRHPADQHHLQARAAHAQVHGAAPALVSVLLCHGRPVQGEQAACKAVDPPLTLPRLTGFACLLRACLWGTPQDLKQGNAPVDVQKALVRD